MLALFLIVEMFFESTMELFFAYQKAKIITIAPCLGNSGEIYSHILLVRMSVRMTFMKSSLIITFTVESTHTTSHLV